MSCYWAGMLGRNVTEERVARNKFGSLCNNLAD